MTVPASSAALEELEEATSPTSVPSERATDDAPIPPTEGDVSVSVLTLAGREVVSLRLPPETKMSGLKQRIKAAGGPDVRLQVLSCGSQILATTETCASLGWTADEPVTVTMARAFPDVDACLAAFLKHGHAERGERDSGKLDDDIISQLSILCCHCKEIFLAEPNMLELEGPWVIVGNMHGYFEQLVKLFERSGHLPDTRYLFLGGYVDRGRRSLDTMALLFLRKVQYPEQLVLLRSNHEEAAMTRIYGFYDECKRRSNVKLWKAFTEVFMCLPMCALIQEKIFCVSGGLSPDLADFDCIRKLERPCIVPDGGLLCDLMWSDPHPEAGWVGNDRGVSYCFGADVVQQFISRTGVNLIVRSHQLVLDGYEFFAARKLVTLWSVHNFKGELGNQAAIMRISEELEVSFEVFDK